MRPPFSAILSNYKLHETHDCRTMRFENTCAIRLSEALVKTEPSLLAAFRSSGRNVCPHGYMRGAQDLAAALTQAWGQHDIGWNGGPGFQPSTSETGVICYMNIPGFSGQGHIDLLNSGIKVGQEYWSASPIWLWRL